VNLDAPLVPLERFALTPDVRHLNHGSFGGCPLEVIQAAERCRRHVEAAPMRFFVLEWQAAIDAARLPLARFLNAPLDRLAFVQNVTTGVAIALASTKIEAGDELLTTDHAYRATKNQLMRMADERGAQVVVATLPLPFDADAAVDSVLRAVTDHTRVVLLDHITSATALVLPIERIVPALAARGITTIIDGAHAPGQIAVDINALLALGVTWYAGNNHKWLCAPKGSGFIVGTAKPRPIVVSHGGSPEYGPANRFHAELDWPGQHDPSSHLAVPTALELFDWPQVMARNHALAIESRTRLSRALGSSTMCDDSALGTMASVPITITGKPLDLEKRLVAEGWEVPIANFHSGPFVRICAHVYNHAGEADALAEKLRSLGVTGR
jgi:isopenicillin-N epimerase